MGFVALFHLGSTENSTHAGKEPLLFALYNSISVFHFFFCSAPQKSTPNRSMLCDHMEIYLSAGFPGQHGSLGYQATNEQMVLSLLISEKVIPVITSANKPFLSIL